MAQSVMVEVSSDVLAEQARITDKEVEVLNLKTRESHYEVMIDLAPDDASSNLFVWIRREDLARLLFA